MDNPKVAEFQNLCFCNSGKKSGECHRKDEPCPCGSGKVIAECGMKDPETHGM